MLRCLVNVFFCFSIFNCKYIFIYKRKHPVFRDVKSGKVSIKNAEHFAVYAGSILNGITSFYMPVEDVSGRARNVNSSPIIPGTLEFHKIARLFSTDGICKMEFYYTVVDQKPFDEHWYRTDGDPDVCSHTELIVQP